jgi:hypothetical protein
MREKFQSNFTMVYMVKSASLNKSTACRSSNSVSSLRLGLKGDSAGKYSPAKNYLHRRIRSIVTFAHC